jgi:hypothetical protein
MPAALVADYTYGGRVAPDRCVVGLLLDQTLESAETAAATAAAWSEAAVEDLRDMLWRGNLSMGYGPGETAEVLAGAARLGLRPGAGAALVVGSRTPWLEAVALEAGAETVTTIEYGALPTGANAHPRLRALTPDAARRAALRGELGGFDAALTFSSVEHSGLGRYGDGLNPWGDIQALARVWCLCRPGARLLLGVPQRAEGDRMVWNAHREYGPAMWPHLVPNWRLLWEGVESYQRVRVFEKA